MGGGGEVAEDEGAIERREEGYRREEAIRSLLKRHDAVKLTVGAVDEIANELGVSRSTMYRLITAYRAKGTVSSVEPRALGRRKDTLVLDAKREMLIAATIHEIFLKPERPTMTYLVEQVRARCRRKGLHLPHRRTIKARVDRIDRRTVALKRKDLKGVKATKAVPGQYAVSRPLEVVQIDHTEVDVFLVDETTRKAVDKRPWLTLAVDVFTRMVVGFHLSMDKPSRVSLGLCMLSAVYDKSSWLKERGIDASWPAAGLPEAVHADNGADFRSRAFSWACREEGIKVIFRPRGAPHYGGHIERLIGTVMGRVHFYPGSTFSNPVARQGNKPGRFSAMTFREFECALGSESRDAIMKKFIAPCSARLSRSGGNAKRRWLCACLKTAWRFGCRFCPTTGGRFGPTGSGSTASPTGLTRSPATSGARKASFSSSSTQETFRGYSLNIPTAGFWRRVRDLSVSPP